MGNMYWQIHTECAGSAGLVVFFLILFPTDLKPEISLFSWVMEL